MSKKYKSTVKKARRQQKSQIQDQYTTTLSNTHKGLHSKFKRQYIHTQYKVHSN